MMTFKRNALLGNISGQPLCSDFKSAWRQCGSNKEMLVRLALMQQSQPFFSTACYKSLGLSKEYIKEEYKDYINGYIVPNADGVNGYTYALYVDWGYENDLEIKTDVASIMWTTNTNVVVEKTKCPTIYISNKSSVNLICNGFNTIHVKLFDKSKLFIDDFDSESQVIVYRYSDDAKVEEGKFYFGKVKVFDKELKL